MLRIKWRKQPNPKICLMFQMFDVRTKGLFMLFLIVCEKDNWTLFLGWPWSPIIGIHKKLMFINNHRVMVLHKGHMIQPYSKEWTCTIGLWVLTKPLWSWRNCKRWCLGVTRVVYRLDLVKGPGWQIFFSGNWMIRCMFSDGRHW